MSVKKERIYFRVSDRGLIPADSYAATRLREKRYKPGDVVAATLVKLRNPRFNRLVHRIGQLAVENIEAFRGMDAHAAIKRLQWEGNIACDEVGVSMRAAWHQFGAAILSNPGMDVIEPALRVVGSMLPEKALLPFRQPRSLSFDSLDEGEFHEAARGICRVIAEKYWPAMSAEKIEAMAESFIQEM